MKLLIAVCLVAMVAASPVPKINYPTSDVQLINYENDNYEAGRYRYSYEQSDGTKQEQKGEIINEGREDEYLAVTGSFAWFGPDGVLYIIRYKADENGYQPEIEQGPGGAVPAHVASLLG